MGKIKVDLEEVLMVLKMIREKCKFNQFQYAIITEAIEKVENLGKEDADGMS